MTDRRPASGPEPAGASRRGRRRLRRIAAVVGGVLLVLLVLVGAALTWLAATPSGLQFASERARPYLPEGIAFESVEGRLLGPLAVHGLRVEAGGTDVRVQRIGLDWAPFALLGETLRIHALEVTGVQVAVPPAAPEAPPGESGPLRLPGPPAHPGLPFGVVLERFAVDDVRVTAAGEPLAAVDRVRLRARLDGERIALEDLRVEAPAGQVEGRLSLGAAAPRAAAGALDWRLAAAGERPALAGRLRLDGTLADLALRHTLTAPTAVNLRGRLRAFGDDPSWEARLDWPETRPADWWPGAPAGTVAADLDLAGSFSEARVDGGFRLAEVPGGPYAGELALAADAAALALDRLVLRREGGTAEARLGGDVAYAGEGAPRFDLALEWQALQWPLEGEVVATSPSGRLAVEGTPDDYALEGEGRFLRPLPDWPVASLVLAGQGSTTALSGLTGRVDWGDARLDLDGGVRWARSDEGEGPGARLDVVLERLPLAPLAGGRVTGRIGARAELEADWGEAVNAELRLGELRGELNGRPLEATARARYEDGAVVLPRLRLSAGEARLSLSGRLDEEVRADWSLRVPELEALYPDAAGRLEGSGQVRGPRDGPTLTGDLRGDELRWQGIAVRQLELEARAAAPGDLDGTAELAVSGIAVAGREIDEIDARLEGSAGRHRLRVALAAPEGTAALAVAGGLDGADWRGRLVELALQRREQGAWRLEQPADLAWVEGRGSLAPACLARDAARVCVAGEGDASEWRARLDADAIPYALAAPFAPPGLGFDGRLDAEARFEGAADGVTGSAAVALGAGEVTGPTDEGRGVLLAWDAGSLEATLAPERVDGRLALPLADGGRLAASVGVGLAEPRPLAGRVVARVRDPSIVTALVPQIGSIEGRFEADLELGGTLAAPRLSGDAQLADGRLGVVPLGIELRELELALETLGRGLRLRAAASSGEGRLEASIGVQQADDGGWSGEGEIRGEAFRAAGLPDLGLVLSPDLRWRVADRRVELEGRVAVPGARIAPRDLSGAVQPSPDAVIVDADGNGAAEAERWRVDATVDVVLGDDVRIDAFGLEGRLGGALTVRERPGTLTAGTGELRVEEGQYEIYRQKLEIERGRVLFEGGPLIDPGLDVRAVRRPRDVVVGVNVRGTLREPRADLFSEPPMPESEQLSYLIAGVPLSGSSGEDRSAMAAVAGALATSEKGRALADDLGIDEVTIDRDADTGASLVLGRYLSPRLYVGYGIGLAEQANSVRMRYELSRRWTLEGESGVATGADLLYTIERD